MEFLGSQNDEGGPHAQSMPMRLEFVYSVPLLFPRRMRDLEFVDLRLAVATASTRKRQTRHWPFDGKRSMCLGHRHCRIFCLGSLLLLRVIQLSRRGGSSWQVLLGVRVSTKREIIQIKRSNTVTSNT